MKDRRHKEMIAALVLTMVLAPAAYANMGVPMLVVVAPASWLLLLAIIPVEAGVLSSRMRTGFSNGLKASAAANLVSTLLGIPLTWALMFGVEWISGRVGSSWPAETPMQTLASVTLQSAWLLPLEERLAWMIPAAAAFLCVPFFFMSSYVENRIVRRFFEKQERRAVRRAVWTANLATYVPITLSLLAYSCWRYLSR